MDQDLFECARKLVDDKSVFARIGHSGAMDPLRRAFFSSPRAFASKAPGLALAAGRATFALIPFPGVGTVAGLVVKYGESKFRKWRRSKRQRPLDLQEAVKVGLKDISVTDLDSDRSKVMDAIGKLSQLLAQDLDRRSSDAREEGRQCDFYLELAVATEQASRRIEILQDKCEAIKRAMEETLQWLKECESGKAAGPGPATGGVDGVKNRIMEELTTIIGLQAFQDSLPPEQAAELTALHENCNHWCFAKDTQKTRDWSGAKKRMIQVAKFLSDPFTVQDAIGLVGNPKTFDPQIK